MGETLRNRSDRLRAVGRAAVLCYAILALSTGTWGTLLVLNLATTPSVFWAVAAMGLVLWAGWQYLGGRWRPASTSARRRSLLRARRVPARVFGWSLVAGVLAVIALAGYWIVLFQLVRMPPNFEPDFSAYSPLVGALALGMASLNSPLAEEAAFRGYAQVTLERVFSGRSAVAISSVLFAIAHVTVAGLWLPKLFVYFLVGVTFGTIAYRSKSTLPALPVHIFGDVVFFALVWPNDAARRLVWDGGADGMFWLHVVQAVLFTVLAVWAFRRLARVTEDGEVESASMLQPSPALAGSTLGAR